MNILELLGVDEEEAERLLAEMHGHLGRLSAALDTAATALPDKVEADFDFTVEIPHLTLPTAPAALTFPSISSMDPPPEVVAVGAITRGIESETDTLRRASRRLHATAQTWLQQVTETLSGGRTDVLAQRESAIRARAELSDQFLQLLTALPRLMEATEEALRSGLPSHLGETFNTAISTITGRFGTAVEGHATAASSRAGRIESDAADDWTPLLSLEPLSTRAATLAEAALRPLSHSLSDTASHVTCPTRSTWQSPPTSHSLSDTASHVTAVEQVSRRFDELNGRLSL